MIKGIELERWLSLEDLEGEVWKDIEGFDGVYEISNFGRVKSHNYGTLILKTGIQRNGYENIRLWKDSKPNFYLIHRLVYSHFVGCLKEKLVIDHIDGDKTNNKYTNLQQISSRQNTSKAVENKYMRGVKKNNKGEYYTAAINVKYKRYYLGSFKTIEEANAAYEKALYNYKENGILPQVQSRAINRVVNGYKICNVCGENKPISMYHVCSGVIVATCKKCSHKKQAEKRAIKRGDKPLNMHKKTWEKIKKNIEEKEEDEKH